MNKQKNKTIIEIIILALIDQIIKLAIFANKEFLPIQVINNILKINYVENFGVAFGLAKGDRIIFIIINVIIIGIIMKFLFTQTEGLSKTKKISFIIISSGGIGNLIDRIFRGYVIDYIDFSQMINFPVFNLADIMIVVGTIYIAFIILFDLIKENKKM